jgi:hypothetical protein
VGISVGVGLPAPIFPQNTTIEVCDPKLVEGGVNFLGLATEIDGLSHECAVQAGIGYSAPTL